MRSWKDLSTREIRILWNEYLRTDGFLECDEEQFSNAILRPMKLTPMDITRLMQELIDRLEVKEIEDVK